MLRRRAEIGGDGLRAQHGSRHDRQHDLPASASTRWRSSWESSWRACSAPRSTGCGACSLVSFGTLFALLAVGIDDKYINQDHPDQQAAFEIAFTLQAMLSALLTLIALMAIPVFSIVYDEPRILVPGLLLAVTLPLLALQAPIWVFYRRMDFVKQRLLEGSNRVAAFVVTMALALAGVGFWSLVVGTLAGTLVATFLTVRSSPYKLRFRYERGRVSRVRDLLLAVVRRQHQRRAHVAGAPHHRGPLSRRRVDRRADARLADDAVHEAGRRHRDPRAVPRHLRGQVPERPPVRVVLQVESARAPVGLPGGHRRCPLRRAGGALHPRPRLDAGGAPSSRSSA